MDQVDAMEDDEVDKLYCRYEARLGAAMTKTMGRTALQLYAILAGLFLPLPAYNRSKLVADLEADPFVEHALSSATCELYHRYGTYLAPLATVLTTAQHCQFGQPSQPLGSNGGTRGASADETRGASADEIDCGAFGPSEATDDS